MNNPKEKSPATAGSQGLGRTLLWVIPILLGLTIILWGVNEAISGSSPETAEQADISTLPEVPPPTEPPVIKTITSPEIPALIEAGGGSVVVVHIFGSWCLPCEAEFPDFTAVMRKYERLGVKVVALAYADNQPALDEFLRKIPPSFPVYFIDMPAREDAALFQQVLERAGINFQGGVPHTTFIGRDGKTAMEWEGAREGREYERVLQALL